jgi:hypothetical protein
VVRNWRKEAVAAMRLVTKRASRGLAKRLDRPWLFRGLRQA